MNCGKGLQIKRWDPLETFVKSSNQSEESFHKQKFAISNALCSIKSYAQQFGPGSNVHVKNTIVHGCPGSGKSYIGGYACLAVISLGLHLMTTALMATRANMLGGIHFHRLFCLPIQRNSNTYRVAEIAIVKLHHPCNVLFSLRYFDNGCIDD